MKESIMQNYSKYIRYDEWGDITHFCGYQVKVRQCGKLRVVGNKFLTKILNTEL